MSRHGGKRRGAGGRPEAAESAVPRLLDFSAPVLVTPAQPGRVDEKAATVLLEEIAKRTGISPLRIAYGNLDPHAAYSVRAAYTAEIAAGRPGRMRLVANDRFLVSDRIQSLNLPIQESAIPREVTAGGRLVLEWRAAEGEAHCGVAEVWLIRHAR
ncbi:MAG: hypothetical protein M1457_11335 [bacterium]|nr:hypothetical protein [bacterium]